MNLFSQLGTTLNVIVHEFVVVAWLVEASLAVLVSHDRGRSRCGNFARHHLVLELVSVKLGCLMKVILSL